MTPQEARDILKTEQIGDSERMELAKQMGAQTPNYCDCCGQAFDWGELNV